MAKFIAHFPLEVISRGCNEVYVVLAEPPVAWQFPNLTQKTEEVDREKEEHMVKFFTYSVLAISYKLKCCSLLQSVIYSFILP